MKLPHPESTIIDDHKLTGYSLNLNHADGRHKARVFQSALNLDIDDVQFLKNAILEAVKTMHKSILNLLHNQFFRVQKRQKQRLNCIKSVNRLFN